jgi:DNA-binding beta-propeller fold protein YncE
MLRKTFLLLAALAVTAAACSPGREADAQQPEPVADAAGTVVEADAAESFAGTEPAPEFPEGLDWLNTGGAALTLEELQGKIVLLDFWTYGCINCIHIIPDLERLEEEYHDELVVVGVHSAKFENESATDNIRQVILRYGLEHPVVNDRDFQTWSQWGAQAWPTIALIDPAGNVVGVRSGEGVYAAVQPVMESLIGEFDSDIDRTALDLRLEREGLPSTILSFPGKVHVAPDESEVFIADTNHNRIIRASLPDGEVSAVYGSGRQGLVDGPALQAQFNQPQGLVLSEDAATLYVADTNNHAVRSIDLATGEVLTFIGTGRQAAFPPTGGSASSTDLSSPWDLELSGNTLYIAMAGTHQIWAADISTEVVGPFSGSALEDSTDGDADSAALAQPSGLSLDDGGRLYFADSESSSIRFSETLNGAVDTVVGAENGLFEFGDIDGEATEVRLQHPLGVAWAGDRLFVADTYNSKIKVVDPETRESITFAGDEAGWQDGATARFYEPGGLDFAEGTLFVADTNNHAVRLIDIASGNTETLLLKGVEAFQPPPEAADYGGEVVVLPGATVAPGAGSVVIDISLPPDHKVNEEAPSSVSWKLEGDVANLGPEADRSLTGTTFPVEFPATFSPGEGAVTADINLVWCADDAESLCFLDQIRLSLPLQVAPGGGSSVTLLYSISLPEI